MSKTNPSSKKPLYFSLGGSKKIYLGTPENPKRENLKLALAHLSRKINKYEEEYSKLDQLLYGSAPFVTSYQLVIFDLDGVIFEKPWRDSSSQKVAVSSWDVLFQEMGIYPMHQKLKKRFENGEFTYMQWTQAACRALKDAGLNQQTFDRVVRSRQLTAGAEVVLRKLSSATVVGSTDGRHPIIGVISGSFDALAHRLKNFVADGLHIEAHCSFEFDKKGEVKEPFKLFPTDFAGKAEIVRKWIRELGLPKQAVAYVGDDVNDFDAFGEVGLSIAFNAEKPLVREAARVVVDSRNMKSILPHLEAHGVRDVRPQETAAATK